MTDKLPARPGQPRRVLPLLLLALALLLQGQEAALLRLLGALHHHAEPAGADHPASQHRHHVALLAETLGQAVAERVQASPALRQATHVVASHATGLLDEVRAGLAPLRAWRLAQQRQLALVDATGTAHRHGDGPWHDHAGSADTSAQHQSAEYQSAQNQSSWQQNTGHRSAHARDHAHAHAVPQHHQHQAWQRHHHAPGDATVQGLGPTTDAAADGTTPLGSLLLSGVLPGTGPTPRPAWRRQSWSAGLAIAWADAPGRRQDRPPRSPAAHA